MSELIDNNNRQRQEILKQIIKDLHSGVPVERLQKKFARLIREVSPEEIAAMENALIEEGFPPEEIQRLCDVHAQVFEKSLRKTKKASNIPGHPVYTFLEENRHARQLIKKINRSAKRFVRKGFAANYKAKMLEDYQQLKAIIRHYERKENQLFPILEAKKFSGPTKVMWGKHDEIREHFRAVDKIIAAEQWEALYRQVKTLTAAIKRMIFLEEKILFPTAMKKLGDAEWAHIKRGGQEIGYAWVTPSSLWEADLVQRSAIQATDTEKEPEEAAPQAETRVSLDEGALTAEQIRLLLKNLPLDITFVDENDRVRFYSATEDRIFPRSPNIIGRSVQNCHPPKSVHIVNSIIESFKNKEKQVAEFWIQKEGLFIHIRYFPVYDKQGEYRGVVEATQEVSHIRSLEGERRILDW